MKKIILMANILVALNTVAQEKYTTYTNKYLKKTHDIDASNKSGSIKLYFDISSLDSHVEKVGFVLPETEIDAFIKSLEECKAKYIEWVETAKANNVDKLSLKPMSIKNNFKSLRCYFMKYTDWEFTTSTVSRPYFFISDINENAKYIFLLKFDKLTSNNNRYINCDSSALILTSVEDFDHIISVLNKEKINNSLNAPKEADLFN